MRSPLDRAAPRTRRDRCPGVLRPWPADDGGLVRIRIPGGRVDVAALLGLLDVAERYGDGRIHVTGRANLQVRGLPLVADALDARVVAAVEATGLLPSRRHDLVRNILASPQTGLAGGRADLWPVVADLDRLLLTDDRYGDLPGRFLFTLDDGRGDLADRHRDLGLVALDAARGQLRVGTAWGPVLPLADAAAALADLTRAFLDRRGSGPGAAWHVAELDVPLIAAEPPAPGAEVASQPLPYGAVPGGRHEQVGEAGLDRHRISAWTEAADHLVITPWHGVFVPDQEQA